MPHRKQSGLSGKQKASLLLTCTLVGSLLTGCANQGSTTESVSTPQGTSEGKISFKYWSPLNPNAAAVVKNLGEVEMYKELEKRTGVHADFSHPPQGNEKEQFNLLIASKDLPDLMEYNWLAYPGGPEKAINDKVIIKLNDLVDKFAPNLKKYLNDNPQVAKQVKTDSGTMYVIPSLGIGKVNTFSGPLVRKDWLDELGLAVPETLDEWTKVLREFKSKKGVAAPYTTYIDKADANKTNDFIAGAFGIGRDFYLDNGKVKYGPLEPAYKEYLQFLRSWYKEGLIDPDFGANDKKTIDAKMTSGKSGAVFGFAGSSIGVYLKGGSEKDPKYDLAAAQYPVLKKGDQPSFVNKQVAYRPDGSVAVSASNKHPEEAVKWLDYMFSEEGHMLESFGVEGQTYKLENGYPKYTDLILKNPDKLAISLALTKFTRANYPSPGFVNDDRYLEQFYELKQQKESIQVWGKFENNADKVKMPLVSATQEESEQLAKIMAEVRTYSDEMYTKFIMGAEPVENFDQYVNQMKKMNIEKAIQLQQAAVDRFNKR
ncbi:extracellular solute-binding protein [Bacillus sp. 3255]|uniref:extracellular solute-binding protein n=1 Tax=Bacillus sp. 3255 TaxID=2817904 RepID=UPI002862515F|nr:extracellular solute-binding protein [Bacillus sp. 3255]MDR6880812.1 putative aldouronate transport system substrate-binding protein [Bacillus sp. 3255]